MKKCPFCAEEIQDEAIVCKHCGRELVDENWQRYCEEYARLAPDQQRAALGRLTVEERTQAERAWKALGLQHAKLQPPALGTQQRPMVVVAPKPKTSPLAWGCLALVLALAIMIAIGTLLPSHDMQPVTPAAVQSPPVAASGSRIKDVQRGLRLRRVGGQGQVDFATASPQLAADVKLLEREARRFCDDRRAGAGFCRVMIWRTPADAATGLPMSDAALASQLAQYTRNRNTLYDCFYVLRNGDMVEESRSVGCS